jgi:hypothetical protein
LPLSKCYNLVSLDLSLVTDHISSVNLSTCFSNLHNVKKLHLSRSLSRDITDSCHLPPNLTHLLTNGTPPYSSNPLPAFIYPPSLTTLSIIGLEGISSNCFRHYAPLTHLYLIDCFSNPRPPVMYSILPSLPNLLFLSAPGRAFDAFFFSLRIPTFSSNPDSPPQLQLHPSSHPLQTIEFGRSMSSVNFPLALFIEAVVTGLTQLRCLRVQSGHCSDRGFLRDLDVVEEVLVKRWKGGVEEVEGEEEGEDGEEGLGVVFFD